jgi:hypothetical protein
MPGDFRLRTELNLAILLVLLTALLTATALLAALLTTLTSGLLLLLTRLLLATLLLSTLLHITHLVTRHEELSFAEGLRGTTISLIPCSSRSGSCARQ